MNFADIRNNLYERAEKYWWISLLLGIVVQLISIFSTIFQNSTFLVISSSVLFFIPIVARWFQEKSADDTLRALKCRLAILYSDAFGDDIPHDIAREIKSWVDETKLSKAPFKRPYYDSKLPVGPQRLADIISESAFWTYKLASDMRSIMFVYTGVYLIISLAILNILFQINLGVGTLVIVARLIVGLISLVFTSEAILLIKQYNELYSEAKQIYVITAKLASIENTSVSEIMQIVERYNLLLISSPPLPSRLYKYRQHSLNKACKKIIKNE